MNPSSRVDILDRLGSSSQVIARAIIHANFYEEVLLPDGHHLPAVYEVCDPLF